MERLNSLLPQILRHSKSELEKPFPPHCRLTGDEAETEAQRGRRDLRTDQDASLASLELSALPASGSGRGKWRQTGLQGRDRVGTWEATSTQSTLPLLSGQPWGRGGWCLSPRCGPVSRPVVAQRRGSMPQQFWSWGRGCPGRRVPHNEVLSPRDLKLLLLDI